jgi:uncharacterized membrane protein
MPSLVVIIAILFVAVGLLMMGLAIPLMRRRIAPNQTYGLRTAATFADEWVWYEANARSGRDLAIFGVIQSLVAVLPPLLMDLRPNVAAIVYLAVNVALGVIGAVSVTIVGCLRANQLLRERRSRFPNQK